MNGKTVYIWYHQQFKNVATKIHIQVAATDEIQFSGKS